jgi:endonuclease/exonuclease/phosphatase family metal-dependent hydrolase
MAKLGPWSTEVNFSVLQWNVDYGEDIRAVAEFLKAVRADVVCLQELTVDEYRSPADSGAYLSNELSYYGHFAYGPNLTPGGRMVTMGVGIFSRFTLSERQRIGLQPAVVAGAKTIRVERDYLAATVCVGAGMEITVGTAQLLFHPMFRTTPGKQAMINTILDQVPDTGRYIFAGDLNSTPRSKAARAMRTKLVNAGPALTRKTWTKRPVTISRNRFDRLRWRLDYILYQGELEPSGSKVLATPLSDHEPLLVRFDLRLPSVGER